ncbi:MAG: peptide chain release factor N(5)-glutamine methyltransferase [Peptostreptococcaceae bacterium]|nr:peptide chain release factor N(5)-glutamine methyltransferase [Peptostreptococcaceae bacterium]
MILRQLILELKKSLDDSSASPLLDAQLIAGLVLGRDRLHILTNPSDEISIENENRIRALARKRRSGVPLQHITGKQEFMGLDFEVGPQVLIPRPDTEILVEEAISDLKNRGALSILDIGTGSGAIAVSLAKYLPLSNVYAVDISKDALETAAINAARNGVEKRVEFLLGSLFEPFEDIGEKADAIVSNPPYIPAGEIDSLQREVAVYEPRGALDGGSDGLEFYRAIVEKAPRFLKHGGMIYLEVGAGQAEAVENLLKQVKCGGESCYNNILRIKDLAGIERVVKASLRSDKIEDTLRTE